MLDCATLEPGRDPLTDLDVIEAELAAYSTDLSDRPRAVVLNKIDVPDARELAELVTSEITARGLDVFAVSSATREGVRALSLALAERVAEHRAARPPQAFQRVIIRPRAVDEPDFAVRAQDDGFVVTGAKPLRWVRQTDFSNDEAIGFLADRLARLGVEAELARLGAESGVAVTIGDVTFDWEPQLSRRAGRIIDDHEGGAAGPESTLGPRGSDDRLLTSTRLTRAQRLARRARDREALAGRNADLHGPDTPDDIDSRDSSGLLGGPDGPGGLADEARA